MGRKEKAERQRPIETYEHAGKKRLNNPPAGLVTPETDSMAVWCDNTGPIFLRRLK
jgi:hypothetical protein